MFLKSKSSFAPLFKLNFTSSATVAATSAAAAVPSVREYAKMTARERKEKKHAESVKIREERKKAEQMRQDTLSGKKKAKTKTAKNRTIFTYEPPKGTSIQEINASKLQSTLPTLQETLPVSEILTKKLHEQDGLESFLTSRQAIDFDKDVVGYFAMALRDLSAYTEQAIVKVEDVMQGIFGQEPLSTEEDLKITAKPAAKDALLALPTSAFLSSLGKIERVKDEVSQLLKAVIAHHPNEDLKATAQGRLEEFTDYIQRRYKSSAKIFQYVKSSLEENKYQGEAEKQFLEVLLNKRMKSLSTLMQVENVYARSTQLDLVQEQLVAKQKDIQSSIQALSKIQMENPSRLYELPKHLIHSIEKARIKKKKIGTLNLIQLLSPILENVTQSRVRHFVVEQMRSAFVNDTSALNTLFTQYQASALQIIQQQYQLAENLAQYNLDMQFSLSQAPSAIPAIKPDDIFELFTELKNAMQVDIPQYLRTLETLKKDFYTEFNKKHQIAPTNPETKVVDDKPKRGGKGKKITDATVLAFDKESELNKIHPNDILYVSKLYAQKDKVFNTEDVKQFFPVHRCVDHLLQVIGNMLQLKPQLSTLAPGESMNPKYVKKVEFVDEQGIVQSVLYLDLFNMVDAGDEIGNALTEGSVVTGSADGVPRAVITLNFEAPSIGVPTLLTHHDMRKLFFAAGKVVPLLMNARDKLWGNFVTNESQVLSLTAGYLFERMCYNVDMLKTIGKHHLTQQPLNALSAANQMAKDFASVPSMYPLQVLNQMVLSVADLEFFSDTTKTTTFTQQIKKAEEKIMVENLQVVVDPALLSQSNGFGFGGTLSLDLFCRVVAAQLARATAAQRQFFTPAESSTDSLYSHIIKSLKGKIDVAPFVQDLTMTKLSSSSPSKQQTPASKQ